MRFGNPENGVSACAYTFERNDTPNTANVSQEILVQL